MLSTSSNKALILAAVKRGLEDHVLVRCPDILLKLQYNLLKLSLPLQTILLDHFLCSYLFLVMSGVCLPCYTVGSYQIKKFRTISHHIMTKINKLSTSDWLIQ